MNYSQQKKKKKSSEKARADEEALPLNVLHRCDHQRLPTMKYTSAHKVIW